MVTSDPTSGPCPDGNGITVVVDPGDLGGGVQVRCVNASPSSGMVALGSAGFDVDPTVRFAGFVCRIDGRPASDPCIDTPPATAYWSYWIADRGGPWCYSDLGGAARVPVRGTVEGWSFSRGGRESAPRSTTFGRLPGPQRLPASACDRGPAPTTTAAPTLPPRSGAAPPPPPAVGPATTVRPAPTQPGTSGAATTVPAPTPSEATTTTQPQPDDSAVASPDGTTTTTSTSPTATTAAEDDSPEELASSTVELADSGRSGGSSPVGTAVAASAMGLLLASAVFVNRRRLKPLEVDPSPVTDSPGR